jgi:hypothetical protein
MSPADLATLSLLDADQGACPNGHACRLDGAGPGIRKCSTCDFGGMALICWDITGEAIATAEFRGADVSVVAWANAFLSSREPEV